MLLVGRKWRLLMDRGELELRLKKRNQAGVLPQQRLNRSWTWQRLYKGRGPTLAASP